LRPLRRLSVPTGSIKEYDLEVKKDTKVEQAAGTGRRTVRLTDLKVGQQLEAVCGKVLTPSNLPLVALVKSILILSSDR